MKKKVLVIIICFLAICVTIQGATGFVFAQQNNAAIKETTNEVIYPKETVNESICRKKSNSNFNHSKAAHLPIDDPVRLKDIVITFAMPTIQKAVDDFYKPYLAYPPMLNTYNGSKIVSIKGGEQINEGTWNSFYTITIDVFPYVGAHNDIGKDRITLSVNPMGVTVEKFEHLESYEIPPWLLPYVKKPLP